MKDFYTRKSREEGYHARSVYKLKDINKKFKVIKKGNKVLDLGCSPGGWIQASLEIVGEHGQVIGIDIANIKKIKAKNFKFIKADIHEVEIKGKFHIVLSDMAPKTTGDQSLDHERSYDLAKTALKIAKKHLLPKGNFICKIFQGRHYQEFLKEIKQNFNYVKTAKPEASRKKSKEMYIIAKNMKPQQETTSPQSQHKS